jgi:serine/threonine-protein kinase PknK
MGTRLRAVGTGVDAADGRIDRPAVRSELGPTIAAELAAAGFGDAHVVGRGGFGTVYRCQQRSLERTVAIKVLTTDVETDNLERFLREQRAMGKLSGHPNITNIFQVGATKSGRPYIVMQYHPHDSLRARIHATGPICWQETLHIGVKMLVPSRQPTGSTPCTATSNRQTSYSPNMVSPS